MTPTLLPTKQYLADLITHINQARHRVVIMSLIITNDSATHELFAALSAAAERGVAVDIATDTYTFSEFGNPFNPFKRHVAKSRHAIASLAKLERAGCTVHWLGKNTLNPFAGVTHSKWSITDTTCYVFGGINLYHDGIASSDFMIRIEDKKLADTLIQQQRAIIAHPNPLYSGVTATHALGTWHIDSGKPNDSPIYTRAIQLAQEAKDILYVSQYGPSGPLAQVLKSKKAICYYNQPENASFLTSTMLRFDRWQTGIVSRYRKKKYIHAKFILFTMPNGQKIALTGSHNFTYKGVQFGTREIALETTNADLILQLETFFRANIE